MTVFRIRVYLLTVQYKTCTLLRWKTKDQLIISTKIPCRFASWQGIIQRKLLHVSKRWTRELFTSLSPYSLCPRFFWNDLFTYRNCSVYVLELPSSVSLHVTIMLLQLGKLARAQTKYSGHRITEIKETVYISELGARQSIVPWQVTPWFWPSDSDPLWAYK